jgi:hypothetical protein
MLPGGGSGGTNIRGPPRRSIATGAVPSGIFPYEREPTSEFLQPSAKNFPGAFVKRGLAVQHSYQMPKGAPRVGVTEWTADRPLFAVLCLGLHRADCRE